MNPTKPVTLNPCQIPDWDHQVAKLKGATFFHSSSWARVLSEAYNYTPCYLTAHRKGQMVGLLPLMGIKSILTGSRGVSLPFTDTCQAIETTAGTFDMLWEQAKRHAVQRRWKHIELRGPHPSLSAQAPSATHYIHTLDLNRSVQDLLAGMRSSTRRNIQKAQKAGVTIEHSHTRKAIQDFCRLNRTTRKRHGLPPQPLKFFMKLYDHVISAQKGFILLAKHEGTTTAGALFLLFNDTVIFKYGASNKRHQKVRANNLIMWQAIQWAQQNGYKHFHFGRTEPENQGLLQFKRGWGAVEHPWHYYRFDTTANRFTAPKPKLKTSYNIFKKLPEPLLTLTGQLLYRHIG